MLDLIERKKDEQEHLVLAIAQGVGIAMSPEYATKWQAQHAKPVTASPEAVQQQAGTIGRLAGMFPNNVKVRAH